jgi:hypothetical protein
VNGLIDASFEVFTAVAFKVDVVQCCGRILTF